MVRVRNPAADGDLPEVRGRVCDLQRGAGTQRSEYQACWDQLEIWSSSSAFPAAVSMSKALSLQPWCELGGVHSDVC